MQLDHRVKPVFALRADRMESARPIPALRISSKFALSSKGRGPQFIVGNKCHHSVWLSVLQSTEAHAR
jgi:hypothetical protein